MLHPTFLGSITSASRDRLLAGLDWADTGRWQRVVPEECGVQLRRESTRIIPIHGETVSVFLDGGTGVASTPNPNPLQTRPTPSNAPRSHSNSLHHLEAWTRPEPQAPLQ